MDDALRRRLLDAVDLALGDVGNAAYWYARCGRATAVQLSPDAELRLIRDELEAR